MKNKQSENAVKAGIGYTISNYLLKGITFITLPLFTRLLPPNDYGIFNTYIAYESILYLIIGLTLHTCLKNAKYKPEWKYEDFISSIVLLTMISAIFWLIFANIFYPAIHAITDCDRELISILIIHCLCSSLMALFNSSLALTYSYKTYLKAAGANSVVNVILSIVLIVFVFQGKRYLGRIFGTVFPLIIISFYIVYYFWKTSRPQINKEYWTFAIKYSLPLIPHGVSQVLLNQFDRIMINSMVGSIQAGTYSFAYNIFSIVQVTSTSLQNVWGPWFFQKMHLNEKKKIREKGNIFMILMLFFSLAVMFVGVDLIRLLGTAEYYDSIYCVVPLVAGGYFSLLYCLPANIEYYYEKTKYIMMGTILAALINIALNYVFIIKFGYIAAAYTTMASYFLYFVLHYIIARKICGEFIFSNVTIVICITLILIGSFASILLVEESVIRWTIALMIICVGLIYEEKNLNVLGKYLFKQRSQ